MVHADGKITGCANQSLNEWESLALIGKYAMETPSNTKASQYKSDHLNEKSLDLKKDQLVIIDFYIDCLNFLGMHKDIYNFLRDDIDKLPDNRFLNRIFGKSLIALNQHKNGLGYLKKGSGFIVFQDEKIKYINR